jgi:formylglycine-generating enzyme required for sulfatase activity
MLATETPQDSVNAARPRPANCDIVIVILWSRMGTPLPETVRKPNGEGYLSGTEWEYQDAVTSPQEPPPVVLVYRRTEEPKIGLSDPHMAEKVEQFRRVEGFFARFRNADGSLKGGINEYATANDFKPLVRQHLEEILYRRLPGQSSPSPADPDSLVVPKIPPDYLEWLRRRYASVELLGQDIHQGQAITLNQVYVPALTQPAAAVPDRQDTRRERLGEEEDKRSTLLLQRVDEASLYVPAPAGAGKSTFCRWAVLQSIPGEVLSHPVPAPEEFVEPEPTSLRRRLPLLVPLRDFSTTMDCGPGCRTCSGAELERALAVWVERTRPGGLTGDLLADHLAAGSAFLLLDGLDEMPVSETRAGATVYPRALLLSGLTDALYAWEAAGNRTLLTSRPYGLDEMELARLDMPRVPIEPLPEPLRDLFVTRWFHTLDQPELAEGLIGDLHDRDDLAPLAENPMLLTALCVVYGTGRRLPEDRYHLYQRVVDNVLYHRYPGDAREREPVKARLEAIALGMHIGEDGAPRTTPAAEIGYAETERHLATFAELNPAYQGGRVEPAIQREELLTRSGLLLPRPDDGAAFFHLSLQEFLAAERIARTSHEGRALEQVFRERGRVPEWRPTLLFLFAAEIFNYRDAQWGLDLLERLTTDQERAAVMANSAPAVLLAEALELCLAKGYRIPDGLADGFRRLCLDAIEDEVELQDRQALGLCLGRLGDPRIADLRDPAAYVEVSAGTYPYGEEGEKVTIAAPFGLGRYPVTNGQYRAFVDGGGYGDRQWWSDAGWTWLQREGVKEPAWWRDRRLNGSNQPVVGVSFWEAEAFCAWSGGRLPREQEWEAAARGPEGFTYPWGNDWEDGICNSAEAGLDVTSPVGLFRRSRQARLGIEDLAGNVWEWCSNAYDDPDNTAPPKDPQAGRVLRGGSWGIIPRDLRSAYRYGFNPGSRYVSIGFRVARTF